MSLLADKDSKRARQWSQTGPFLPLGRYLVKVHVDMKERLKREWNATLGDKELTGLAVLVLESSWPSGYADITVLEADRLRSP